MRRPALALLLGCLLLVYQQDIVIHRSTGTAYNETAGGLETWHIFVGEHCREDYGDVRFTNSTGELEYYLWPDYDSSSARFAVRLEGADAAGTLVIWYGNPAAATTSDGDATYFHHDHFDADRSSEYSTSGTVYWNTAESRLEIGSASAAAYITPTASKYRDARIEARVMTRSTVTEPWTAPILLARWNNYLPSRSRYTCGFNGGSSGPNTHQFTRMVDQTQTNLQNTPCELIRDTYYHYAFAVAGINPTHLLAYKDSQLVSSYTDANDLETSDYVGFQANPGEFYIDWILVRAYSATPPAATTFSGEQETAAPPLTAFTATPTAGLAPLTVTFTDTSAGTPTAWAWTFGDSGTSTDQNPQHTYTAPGTYSVTLTATNEYGSDYELKTDYITVYGPITAQLTTNITGGTAPLTVQFTDTSTGGPTSWSWTFGDGNTSTDQNPTHTYTTAGTHTVALTASHPYDSDTETKTSYITVAVLQPFPGLANIPRDLAGNGLYTDINGNNRLDYNDLTVFFQHLAWAKTAQPIACFDFNGNGWLDYNDVITLFSTIMEEHT